MNDRPTASKLPRVRPAIAFTALAILWAATACTEEPSAGPGPYPAALAIITVPVEPLAVGDTLRLASEVRDQHGGPMAEPSVAWSSDNTEVATVSPSGTVTIVGRGTASPHFSHPGAEDAGKGRKAGLTPSWGGQRR